MKYATDKNPAEIALQKIEEILHKNDMVLTFDPYSGFQILIKDKVYNLGHGDYPTNERNGSQQLPRSFDDEKLWLMNPEVLKENKIAGWLKV